MTQSSLTVPTMRFASLDKTCSKPLIKLLLKPIIYLMGEGNSLNPDTFSNSPPAHLPLKAMDHEI